MIARVAATRRASWACSNPWRSSTSVNELAGDVAVLAPAADLVVVELGVLVPERGRLGVLVDVALPAVWPRPRRARRRRRSSGIVRPIRRASSRAGLRRALDRRAARVAPAGRAAACAARPAAVRARAAGPCGTATRTAARPGAPSAARGMRARRARRCAARPRSARQPGELAAARDGDELRARLERAPCAIDSVSSVSPEYDTANTSVPGPTNAGVRYCLSTVTGTGSVVEPAAARTSPAIPEPPMPSTTMLRDRVGRRERRQVDLGRGLVRARRAARAARRRRRGSPASRRHGAPAAVPHVGSKVGWMPSASALAMQARRARRRRRSRPRRSA